MPNSRTVSVSFPLLPRATSIVSPSSTRTTVHSAVAAWRACPSRQPPSEAAARIATTTTRERVMGGSYRVGVTASCASVLREVRLLGLALLEQDENAPRSRDLRIVGVRT